MTDYIVIFLLLFAALAAGWFYLQRAKTRDAGQTAVESEPAQAEPAHSEPARSEPAPSEPAQPDPQPGDRQQ